MYTFLLPKTFIKKLTGLGNTIFGVAQTSIVKSHPKLLGRWFVTLKKMGV
jgi:hypothetical protein